MSDLIDRQAAIDAIERNAYRHTYLDQIISIIEQMPTADLSEYCDKLWKTAYERGKAEAHPKKGKWIKGIGENGVNTSLYCDQCGYENGHWYEWNFCPNCGAKMEE